MKKTMFKNDMGFKKFKNINISITRVIQFVCNPVDIPGTTTHKRMQFNAYIIIILTIRVRLIVLLHFIMAS